MKKASLRGVRPIIKNHPISGRLITSVFLLSVPFYWVAVALKETWPEVRDEAAQMLSVIFLPWEDD